MCNVSNVWFVVRGGECALACRQADACACDILFTHYPSFIPYMYVALYVHVRITYNLIIIHEKYKHTFYMYDTTQRKLHNNTIILQCKVRNINIHTG